jgi:ABC-type nitrate/sulfonate/bicarbonate transport system substrate-binding protein
MDARRRVGTLVFIFAALVSASDGMAQEKITVAYSSVEAPNANWYIAQDNLFYKKYGLDIELIYVPSSTTTVSALVGGSIRVGNISGGAIANAAVGGADVVAVGCFINTLPYELIVLTSPRKCPTACSSARPILKRGTHFPMFVPPWPRVTWPATGTPSSGCSWH